MPRLIQADNMRTIICADTGKYLTTVSELPNVITSLPDAEEVGLSVENWAVWFETMAMNIFGKLPDDKAAIFYQTDRKHKGKTIDKSALLNSAAKKMGIQQVFHKIVLKQQPNTISLFRPSFTHLIAFGNKAKNFREPDVINAGRMVYKNAMGFNACKLAISYIHHLKQDEIIDLFCGMGSVVAIAEYMGLKATGVDIDPKMCEISKKLTI